MGSTSGSTYFCLWARHDSSGDFDCGLSSDDDSSGDFDCGLSDDDSSGDYESSDDDGGADDDADELYLNFVHHFRQGILYTNSDIAS